MTLKYNPTNETYVLFSDDVKKAQQVGFDLSTSVRGPQGEKVWFSMEPYAALAFWSEAEDSVKKHLSKLHDDYMLSQAKTSDSVYPVPDGLSYLPYQKAGIDYALRHKNCLIGDEMGLGKKSRLSCKIFTPDGCTTMGELKIGSVIFGGDGNPCKVTGVYPQGVSPSYKITFRDGTHTHCGAEHLWAVKDRNRITRGKDWTVKSLQELMDRGIKYPKGDSKWQIPLVGPLQYPERDLSIDPYTLGVLIGDEHLGGSSVVFSNPDIDSDINKRVATNLSNEYRLTESRSSSCPRYTINYIPICNKNPINRTIKNLGLKVKSGKKFIPEIYKIASIDQRLEMLKGLMDTDGSCIKNRTTYHTISTKLANDIADLVRSLGGVAIIRGYDRSHENKPFEYQVNVKTMFCPFHTERKAAEWRVPAQAQSPKKFITKVEYIGDEEQQCIAVDSPDHLYVTDDYIVTHNTVEAIGINNAARETKNLVICPASIRLNWQREIIKWSTIHNVTTYPVLKSLDGINPYANYTIISYNLCHNKDIHSALMDIEWDSMIFDEAHFLKTEDAKRTRAMFGGGRGPFSKNFLIQKTKRILTLTGTPLPNRPRECLGSETKVLTRNGWVRIIDIQKTDEVWDGIQWVEHSGIKFQGVKKVKNLAGITVTADHLVLDRCSWERVDEAYQNTDMWSRVLETGSKNLPLSALSGGYLEQLLGSLSSATAAHLNLVQPVKGYIQDDHQCVDHVGLQRVEKKQTQNILVSARITKSEKEFLTFYRTWFKDVIIQTTERIGLMGGGVSKFIQYGLKTGLKLCGISYPLMGSITPSYNSTELTMRRGMYPEIYGGLHEKKICRIEEPYISCKKELTNWKPVYDVVNAGPNKRFTILTDDGPIIVHNCYTISKALCWESIDWMSFDDFCYKFNPSGLMSSGYNREEQGRLPELRARLRCNFMIRRLKKNVLKDLPSKRYEMSYIEPNGAIQKVLSKERLMEFDPYHMFDGNFELDGTPISTLRREMGEAKIPRVLERMKYLLDITEVPKIVLFSHHRTVMDILAEELKHYGIVSHRGGMTPKAKQASIDTFIENPRIRIFSCQLDTAFGLDGLQKAASRLVFAEPAWTPGTNEQAVDRCHRIGQHDNVIAEFLITAGSFDELVLNAVLKKSKTIHRSLDQGCG